MNINNDQKGRYINIGKTKIFEGDCFVDVSKGFEIRDTLDVQLNEPRGIIISEKHPESLRWSFLPEYELIEKIDRGTLVHWKELGYEVIHIEDQNELRMYVFAIESDNSSRKYDIMFCLDSVPPSYPPLPSQYVNFAAYPSIDEFSIDDFKEIEQKDFNENHQIVVAVSRLVATSKKELANRLYE